MQLTEEKNHVHAEWYSCDMTHWHAMLLFYSNLKNTGYMVYWLFSATLHVHDIAFVPET